MCFKQNMKKTPDSRTAEEELVKNIWNITNDLMWIWNIVMDVEGVHYFFTV